MNEYEINKENILLVQFQDRKDKSQINEFFSFPESDAKVYSAIGWKILCIHDSNSIELTHYDAKADKTDLSCLKDKVNKIMVFVGRNPEGYLKWFRMIITSYLEEKDIFSVSGLRECTDSEVKVIDDIFPEFFKYSY